MTLSELNLAIIVWARDRQILEHSSAYAQAFKTAEEVKELAEAKYLMRYLMEHAGPDWTHRHERVAEEIWDAIGDVYVTLIVGGQCYDKEFVSGDQPKQGPSSVADPVLQLQKSLIPLAASSKGKGQYWMTHHLMVSYLAQIAEENETTLEACVNQAYNQIKDRRGHLTANGIFVKEEV